MYLFDKKIRFDNRYNVCKQMYKSSSYSIWPNSFDIILFSPNSFVTLEILSLYVHYQEICLMPASCKSILATLEPWSTVASLFDIF